MALSLAPTATATTAAAPAPASSKSATTPECAVTWGSKLEFRKPYSRRHVTDVRAGRHACFDRLVIDLDAAGDEKPGYGVRYVRRVRADGSGRVVPVRGGARLQIWVNASTLDEDQKYVYRPDDRRELVDADGFDTFRQVAFAGDFEGSTMIALGVRARLPMRVFRLSDGAGGYRLVIDVAHRW
ncbi:hypothetical protein DJ010_19330 [Nocardioides silvaticus]|uniref:AMIN-like domain-containing protein n=1 Tax=Nocardioides silvaticus TaxID=2201891 RepID=A0A316TAL7_9ACTN|nr:hypothetical protein DJ010_19330 [Nocardioides silvaticus]